MVTIPTPPTYSSLYRHSSRIVDTTYGKVQGRRLINEGERQVDAFQGIPFAAPPVGDLRFKKPQPPARWENVILRTETQSPRAMQCPLYPGEFELNGFPSEDCLYLNVFTPCWEPAEKAGFPVMVFIHGGAFEFGGARAYGDKNICENIVTRDVVFVTIQYRLGYLGFMTTGDSACPGNLGLWDQTAALQWVQQNIGAFGGNKDNVTVLGQSAGGASVDYLHLSPHSTNLFHKAICMAGSAECRWASNTNMVAQCRDMAARLGVTDYSDSEQFLEELRKQPAEKFAVDAMKRSKKDDVDFETIPFLGDGDFFPEPIDVLRAKATPKPIMTGVTKEEGILMLMGMTLDERTERRIIDIASHTGSDKRKLADELEQMYITSTPGSEEYGRQIAKVASDYYFNAGVIELCRKSVAIQSEPVYLYSFNHWNPNIFGFFVEMLPIRDATHTCELFYLFGKATLGDFEVKEISETDRRLMREFTTAFTNFAKYGDPNGLNNELPVHWDKLDKNNFVKNYVFDSSPSAMTDTFHDGRTSTFIEIIRKHSTMNKAKSSL